MSLGKILFVGVLSLFGNSLALCPAAYTDLGTGCYFFSIQDTFNWDQSYFKCKLEVNGYLAEIESEQEQNNIAAYLQAVIDPNGEYAWWIGATDILSDGTFRWMTSGNQMTYTNWHNGDPITGNDEHCTHLKEGTSLWNDLNCDKGVASSGTIMKFICETKSIE